MKAIIKQFVKKMPYINGLTLQLERLKVRVDKQRTELSRLRGELDKLHVPPGHYYSPTISKEELLSREKEIWKEHVDTIEGIDLNKKFQFKLLNQFQTYYKELPFTPYKEGDMRYFFENTWYSYSDAIFLYCMMREFKPQRIIEVGSGFSSAVILDTNNIHFKNKIKCTFIDPNSERLNSLLHEDEKIDLIEKPIQDIDVGYFDQLNENDFLFIDSTHVSKTGSDVNYIIFNVLPRLKKGVKIHIHDIFYPFEYPKEWVLKNKRSWNEAYLLRAFLSYNSNFKIIAFNSYLEEYFNDWFKLNMPLCLKNGGGSIWIEVV